MGARLASVMALALAAPTVASAEAKPPTRLFAEDQPIKVTLRGPISAVASTPSTQRTARPATLELVAPVAETHAIQLSPRGRTRRQKERCTFPPLRVEFAAKPAKTSFFERQKRLKLVTHCRPSAQHQQYVLLEYAAYRMFNALSPHGLRARLGTFDYVETNGKTVASRLGFFTEDPDDAASRNDLKTATVGPLVRAAQLDPATGLASMSVPGRAVRCVAGVEATAEIGPRKVTLIGWSSAKSLVGGLASADAPACAASASASTDASRAPMAELLRGQTRRAAFCRSLSRFGQGTP